MVEAAEERAEVQCPTTRKFEFGSPFSATLIKLISISTRKITKWFKELEKKRLKT